MYLVCACFRMIPAVQPGSRSRLRLVSGVNACLRAQARQQLCTQPSVLTARRRCVYGFKRQGLRLRGEWFVRVSHCTLNASLALGWFRSHSRSASLANALAHTPHTQVPRCAAHRRRRRRYIKRRDHRDNGTRHFLSPCSAGRLDASTDDSTPALHRQQ